MEGEVKFSDSESAVIISGDSHVGPRASDLREYCPEKYKRQFDEFVAEQKSEANTYVVNTPTPGKTRRHDLNMKTEGHYDPHARIRDMDRDGIAAQVIFHGSQNGEPFPLGYGFVVDGRDSIPAEQMETNAVGIHMYNAWLADFCSVEPERHIGLAHLPMWDIDAAVRELEWAAEHGLRGVNFPSPRNYMVGYDRPDWAPFWAAAEAHDMHLNTHSGAPAPGLYGDPVAMAAPRAGALLDLEMAGWPSRRGLARMIFGEVFERYPNLKLVLTEQPGVWWDFVLRELDQAWDFNGTPELYELVPKRPSDYFQTNVYIGASFMANYEAKRAYEDGVWKNVIWGTDYPHREGTWAYSEDPEEPNRTILALRDACRGLPEDVVLGITGQNAVKALNLDPEEMKAVAQRISAPSIPDLMAPISESEERWIEKFTDPEEDFTSAFRRSEAWTREQLLH